MLLNCFEHATSVVQPQICITTQMAFLNYKHAAYDSYVIEGRLVSVNCIQQLGFVSILKDIYSFIKIQNITRETAFNKFLFHENPTQEIKV